VPGFQPLETYEVALHNLAPGLERTPAKDAADFLEDHPNEPFAAVEVAAAIARSQRRAQEQLKELESEGRVVRTPAAAGELWSLGSPPSDLDCPTSPRLPTRLERTLAR